MKKKIAVLVFIMIILSLGTGFYVFSQPSSKALSDEVKEDALEKLLGRDVKFSDDTPQGNSIYDGKTISFSYPAKAIVYDFRERSSSSQSAALDDFSFDIKEPRLIFNLKVSKSSINSIDDIPAARLRAMRPEYKKQNFSIEGVKGMSFYNESGEPEKSGFLISNGRIFSFSVTGSIPSEVEKLFDGIISSSKFKN